MRSTRSTVRIRHVSIVALPFVLGACTLFTELSGLRGTGSGDAGIDATPLGDASPDAATDGAVPDGGGAKCPPWILPATCDAKYLSDPKNCCVAGRDCQGGACLNGACQPVTIVPDATTDARGIVAVGDNLVWATGCTAQLRRVLKDGAGNTGLPKGVKCTPTVAAWGANAYFIEFDGSHLNVVPIDGLQPSKVVANVAQAGARSNFARLALDGKNAYWATQTPPGIWYAAMNGDNATASPLAVDTITSETAKTPYGVAVDSTAVYWADQGEGAIKRRQVASLGQDIKAEVVITQANVRDVTLDADDLYWTSSDGFVRRRAKAGSGSGTTLAPGQTGIESIIVDDQYVYWTNYVTGGTVRRIPKAGGTVETLATGQSYPYSITQDCTTIYWTNQANFATGAIVKVAK